VSVADVATVPLQDAVEEARRLLALAESRSVKVRALGGVAVSLSVPSATRLLIPRTYQDIDLIAPKGEQRGLTELMTVAAYAADDEFNVINGHRRLLFYDTTNSRQVDIFIAKFSMCHEVPLGNRLLVTHTTLPLAELLMTKLQIVELNSKDVGDILNLVYHHDPAGGTAAGGLEGERVAECCAADWGLWRTATGNIERARAAVDELLLGDEDRAVLRGRLESLRTVIDAAPKSRKWRMRARVGDRVQWYEEPEEVA
jgi:hypothetical protein